MSTPQPPPPSQQYLPQLHAHLQQHTQQHLQAQQPSAEQVAAGPCGGNWVTVQMGNTAPNGMPAVLPGSANGMSNWPAPATTMPQVAVSQVAPGMQQVVLCSLTPGMMQQMSQAVNVQALLGAQMTGGLAGAMSGNMMPGMQPVMPVTGAMQPTMQPAIQGLVPVAWHNLISVPMPCASPAPSTKLSATPSASPSHAQPQRSQRFPEDGKRHEQHKRSGKGSAVDRPTLQSAAMECVKNDHIEQNEERPLPCPTGVFVDLSPLKACVI